jgi:mono/diheme cytochrome c family protein
VRHTQYVPMFLMAFCTALLGVGVLAYGADAEQGKKIYNEPGRCATCHGPSGKGDGALSANLPVKPRDHTDKAYMSTLSDEDLFKVIKGGGSAIGKSPLMPPSGLNDEQINDVIAYVRTLSK